MHEQKENTGKCRFILNDGKLICNAGQLPYLPTDFQSEEYCINQEHWKCPFYIEGKMRENNTAETDVCTNWGALNKGGGYD